jgi:hypothetical protein
MGVNVSVQTSVNAVLGAGTGTVNGVKSRDVV